MIYLKRMNQNHLIHCHCSFRIVYESLLLIFMTLFSDAFKLFCLIFKRIYDYNDFSILYFLCHFYLFFSVNFIAFSFLILVFLLSNRGSDTNISMIDDGGTMWSRQQNAVSVRHAFKQYGSKSKPNQVLINLNMTVAKGTM